MRSSGRTTWRPISRTAGRSRRSGSATWSGASRSGAASSLQVYLTQSSPQQLDIQRYRSEDGRVVLSAADTNAAVLARKQKEVDAKEKRRARDRELAEKRDNTNVIDMKRGAA